MRKGETRNSLQRGPRPPRPRRQLSSEASSASMPLASSLNEVQAQMAHHLKSLVREVEDCTRLNHKSTHVEKGAPPRKRGRPRGSTTKKKSNVTSSQGEHTSSSTALIPITPSPVKKSSNQVSPKSHPRRKRAEPLRWSHEQALLLLSSTTTKQRKQQLSMTRGAPTRNMPRKQTSIQRATLQLMAECTDSLVLLAASTAPKGPPRRKSSSRTSSSTALTVYQQSRKRKDGIRSECTDSLVLLCQQELLSVSSQAKNSGKALPKRKTPGHVKHLSATKRPRGRPRKDATSISMAITKSKHTPRRNIQNHSKSKSKATSVPAKRRGRPPKNALSSTKECRAEETTKGQAVGETAIVPRIPNHLVDLLWPTAPRNVAYQDPKPRNASSHGQQSLRATLSFQPLSLSCRRKKQESISKSNILDRTLRKRKAINFREESSDDESVKSFEIIRPKPCMPPKPDDSLLPKVLKGATLAPVRRRKTVTTKKKKPEVDRYVPTKVPERVLNKILGPESDSSDDDHPEDSDWDDSKEDDKEDADSHSDSESTASETNKSKLEYRRTATVTKVPFQELSKQEEPKARRRLIEPPQKKAKPNKTLKGRTSNEALQVPTAQSAQKNMSTSSNNSSSRVAPLLKAYQQVLPKERHTNRGVARKDKVVSSKTPMAKVSKKISAAGDSETRPIKARDSDDNSIGQSVETTRSKISWKERWQSECTDSLLSLLPKNPKRQTSKITSKLRESGHANSSENRDAVSSNTNMKAAPVSILKRKSAMPQATRQHIQPGTAFLGERRSKVDESVAESSGSIGTFPVSGLPTKHTAEAEQSRTGLSSSSPAMITTETMTKHAPSESPQSFPQPSDDHSIATGGSSIFDPPSWATPSLPGAKPFRRARPPLFSRTHYRPGPSNLPSSARNTSNQLPTFDVEDLEEMTSPRPAKSRFVRVAMPGRRRQVAPRYRPDEELDPETERRRRLERLLEGSDEGF